MLHESDSNYSSMHEGKEGLGHLLNSVGHEHLWSAAQSGHALGPMQSLQAAHCTDSGILKRSTFKRRLLGQGWSNILVGATWTKGRLALSLLYALAGRAAVPHVHLVRGWPQGKGASPLVQPLWQPDRLGLFGHHQNGALHQQGVLQAPGIGSACSRHRTRLQLNRKQVAWPSAPALQVPSIANCSAQQHMVTLSASYRINHKACMSIRDRGTEHDSPSGVANST